MFLLDVSCGGTGLIMDPMIPNIVSTIVTLIQIGVPILLIIFGMMDLGKAVMAQKDDEIKKGQQTFIKRLVAAAIVFFVILIVKMVVNLLAPSSSQSITGCINCFMTGKTDNNSCYVVKECTGNTVYDKATNDCIAK